MNWTTKPIYQPWPSGSTPIKPSLTINEDGPLGEAGEFTVEPVDQKEMNEWFKTHPDLTAVKLRSNKVPTHDPYTNPNAHIYYSCDCGNILDPGTKRFAELNNAAMAAGWKIRWGHKYYEPFCPECANKRAIE